MEAARLADVPAAAIPAATETRRLGGQIKSRQCDVTRITKNLLVYVRTGCGATAFTRAGGYQGLRTSIRRPPIIAGPGGVLLRLAGKESAVFVAVALSSSTLNHNGRSQTAYLIN